VIGFLFPIQPGFFRISFSERGDKIESRAKRELSLSILSPTVDLSIALSHLLGITFTIMWAL